MPQLIFKAVKPEQVQQLSQTLPEKLSELVGCPADWFTFEATHSTYYAGGAQTPLYPLVEIQQFPRSPQIQREMAELIAADLKALGYPQAEIYFIPLDPEAYYEFG